MNTRKVMVTTLALVSAPLLGGCHAEVEARTPVEYIVMEANGAAQLPAGAATGRPSGIRPGGPEGFWIGRTPTGEYFLRTTTNHRQHRFQGRIRAAGGELTNVRPTRLDFNDRFKVDSRDIVFDLSTQAEEDGFDFGVTQSSCVEFDLRIDGKKDASHIIVGDKEQRTPSSHFIVCP